MIAYLLGSMMMFCFTFSFLPQIGKMMIGRTNKNVSIFMIMLQVVGYFCGVVFLKVESVDNVLLFLNYHAGLFISVITACAWLYCNKVE